jgi:hypothetical protein
MSMTYLQQMAVLPALLVAVAGILAFRGECEGEAARRFLLLLLMMGVVFLLALFITMRFITEPYDQPFFQLSRLLAPSLLAVVALILLNMKGVASMSRSARITAVLLALAMLILFGLLWDSRLGLAYLILPGALALAVAWALGQRYLWLAIALSLLSLGVLLLFNWVMSHPPDYTAGPLSPVVGFLLLSGLYAMPIVAVVMSGVLLTAVLPATGASEITPSSTHSLRSRLVIAGLAFILLIFLTYTIFWGSVWDQTSDGLFGRWVSEQAGIVAFGVGIAMTLALRGKKRLGGLLFILVVPLLLRQSFEMGWRVSYHEITERRAAGIAQALAGFQAREGHYPETLAKLRPRDLLFIRQPVILADEEWCYQGGTDFYRLAAFHREFFSSPVSLRVYEAAGAPPPVSWECEERLAAMKERYYSPMEDPAAFRPPLPTPLPPIEVGIPKTVIQPVLDGLPVAVGSWSPDGRYFVFGAKNGTMTAMTLHFLNGQSGEICTANGDFSYMERLHQYHVWLPDGESEATSDRLLFLDTNGEMTVFTPCQPEGERLTDRFPETFTHLGGRGAAVPENGRILLQSAGAFWILDGRTFSLQPIPDVTPNPYDLHWDQATWLPGGERLVISRLDGRRGNNVGATLYLVNGSSGQVEISLHLPGDFGQSAPWAEGLSETEILLHSSGEWLIVDFSASPPQFTNVLADIFNLDVGFPGVISASGSFVEEGGDGYYLAVRLNHPRNQATYLYHSTTGQVHVYDHEHHTLLLFPDGELWEMAKQETEPTYRDEYDVVMAEQPEATQPRLFLTSHTPREYVHLRLRYLPHTAHLAVASAHGVSLVSLPDGEMVAYWDLVGDGFSPWLLAAPDGSALVAAKDYGGLYYLPLREE